jgi:hypothetical protein
VARPARARASTAAVAAPTPARSVAEELAVPERRVTRRSTRLA